MVETVGKMREFLALDFQDSLRKQIDKNSDKEEYYIFVTAEIEGNTIKTNFVIHPATEEVKEAYRTRFCKILNSMGFYVNNKSGKCDKLWCLPLDIPRDPSTISDDEYYIPIARDAWDKGSPIVY